MRSNPMKNSFLAVSLTIMLAPLSGRRILGGSQVEAVLNL